jgi:tetratricopeptide (TPR) repeat protein
MESNDKEPLNAAGGRIGSIGAHDGSPVIIKPSQRARLLTLIGGALLAALFASLPVVLLVISTRQVREAVFAIVLVGGMSALMLRLTLNFGTTLTLSPTHIAKRPLVGPVLAVAWTEISKVERQKQRLVITSNLDEKLAVGSEFFGAELWPALRRWLPPQWHRELTGIPGFPDVPTPSRSAIALQVFIAVGIVLTNQAARKFDWRSMDARCLQESVLSILGPARSCLDRASAAHDATWMQYLLQHRADANRADRRGEPPLHSAVRNSFPEGVGILVKAHADPLATNRDGATALAMAAQSHDYESLRLMIDAVKERANRQSAMRVLDTAVRSKDGRFRAMVLQELGSLLPKVADPAIEKQYSALLAEAEVAMRRRDYGVVIPKAEEAIALDPQVGAAYLYSGYAYGEMKNWGRAKSRLRKAIELLPNQPDPYGSLANIYFMTGDFDLADEYATRALALSPENWAIVSDRAIYRSEGGHTQAALEDATTGCSHGQEMACELQKDLKAKLEEEQRVAAQP